MVRNEAHNNCPYRDNVSYAGNLGWKNIGRHVKKRPPIKMGGIPNRRPR
jgi:hypothetical protein